MSLVMYLMKCMINIDNSLKQTPKKIIIFDFDETLYRLKLPWLDFKEGLKSLCNEIDPVIVKNFDGELMIHLADQVIDKHGGMARKRVFEFCEKYEGSNDYDVEVNGELLKWVVDNALDYKMVIWSSNMSETVRQVFVNQNVTEFFSLIVGKEDVKRLKPYTDGFEIIYDYFGGEVSDYLMVGDSNSDEGAAKNVGMDFVKVKF